MKKKSNALPTIYGLRDFQESQGRVRRCKIVGTIGPASSSAAVMRDLLDQGLDIARLNFSHGEHSDHLNVISTLRQLSQETKRNVTILQDLQGPKIRAGILLNGSMQLVQNETYTLSYGTKQVDPKVIPIDYQNLTSDIKVGDLVMMDDGLLCSIVKEVTATNVIIQVRDGGLLKSRKGVNFPNSVLSVPTLTEKDNRDLLFGVTHKVDVIALSFVQRAADVLQCKDILRALGSDIPIIAKIERLSAVENIDAIAAVSDGLMVARGDLGVEGSVEKVPGFQRRIIAAASRHAIPVIIATQMLESMIQNPRASLAEVADVANAVLEGADCVMLSAEVAAGKYPVLCVKKMAAIIDRVEEWKLKTTPRYLTLPESKEEAWPVHKAIARAACEAADTLNAKAIVCLTLTGAIAQRISSWRPKTPILAISPRLDVVKRLGYTWGIYGMVNPLFYNTDVLLQDLPNLLKSLGLVNSGDFVVITAGIPLSTMCPTNMLKINRIP